MTRAKTISFAMVHMVVAFLVGWAMTGNPWVGGALALVEPACNTVAYYFHERAWARWAVLRASGAAARLNPRQPLPARPEPHGSVRVHAHEACPISSSILAAGPGAPVPS